MGSATLAQLGTPALPDVRRLLAGTLDPFGPADYDRSMTDELDPTEAARARRRDLDAEAKARELLRPGMGKVFKQIQDAQVEAARTAPKKKRRKSA